MANLMLHAGGFHVERPQLDLVKTPEPIEDRGWFPIPHSVLLEQVTDALGNTGLQVVNEAHALARDGQRYFGLLELQATGTDYTTVVGLRNSHDMSFAAGLVVGSMVFVCDNLAFSGEIKLARKHTRFIMRDLPQLTHAAIGRLTAVKERQDLRIAAYKNTDLSHAQADHLIMELARARVVNPTQILKVYDEYKNPRHQEHQDFRGAAWGLFNAVTEITKGRLADAPRRGQALHGVMDAACGLSFKDLLTELNDAGVEDAEIEGDLVAA